MHRIIRLSLANIKKHKKQTVLLMLLITFCMAIISSALSGSMDMTSLFPRVSDEYAVHKNAIYIRGEHYSDLVSEIFSEDERVTDTDHFGVLFSTATKYLDSEGKEQALYMSFVTKDIEKRIERSPIETTLSDEEISGLEHPIYLPYAGRDSLASKLSEGDNFDIVYGAKTFSFTVAGFYESIFMSETNMGFQMIVSDDDFASLSTVIDKYEMVMYDTGELEDSEAVLLSFREKYEDETDTDITENIMDFGIYEYLDQKSAIFSDIVIAFMLFMAAVIFVAAVIMIRFRIAGDIQDQLQSIGVLEALGYTSGEIALSYTAEYLITAAAGVVIGTGGAFALLPVLHRVAEKLSGHHGSMLVTPLPILLTALVMLIFVGGAAHMRSSSVKKYPPVQALRKGIAVHHFGRNRFPLKNTKKSVHLRIALKGFFGNMRQNIGLTVCIAVSALAAAAGVVLTDMFGSDMKTAEILAGAELADYTVNVMDSADIDELAEHISAMQGVKRVQKGSFSADPPALLIYAFDRQSTLIPVCYDDFTQCEDIQVSDGRFPEHENEVAVSRIFAAQHSLNVGDDITLEVNSIKKDYMISGFIPGITNNGRNLYITTQALKRLKPAYRHSVIEIYLEDGTDMKEFQTQVMQTYGRSVADTRKADSTGDTQEQRLSEQAEKLIAEYIANHGADHIEYSIQIGDRTISGTSSSFAIKNIQNLKHIMYTQIGGIFGTISLTAWGLMGIAAVVSAIIIAAVMEQVIRRQRKDLGIMLGLGYTTRELMLQLALRIMPAVITAVVIGTLSSAAVFNAALSFIVGAAPINIPIMAASIIIMILFCFCCAYLGAGRIKKISVTELMTE